MDADPGAQDHSTIAADADPAPRHPPGGPALWIAWWREGLRTLLLRRPRWELETSPATLLALVIFGTLAILPIERLYIGGAATFYWQGLLYGWVTTCAMAWAAWVLLPAGANAERPTAPMLLTLLLAQSLPLTLITSAVSLLVLRTGALSSWPAAYRAAYWILWIGTVGWWIGAACRAAWLAARVERPVRAGALALIVAAACAQLAQPVGHWYPAPDESAAEAKADRRSYELRQEDFERQAAAFDAGVQALAPQRAGRVDVYTITYAPYDDGVFRRESAMVAEVAAQRLGAQGRVLQLVSQREPGVTLPWATPQNLHRAIAAVAARMNRDEDVLLLHLTSHGAREGELSHSFYPLTVDTLTPAMLRGWLDEVGVRYRIVSVSACYSGSWIAPMSAPDTLVMTAADAEHTSYGCGSQSELTYFGRAMFDEQLRTRTLSFEQAHAQAREVIRRREQEAGKSDGYSNPQIAMGAGIRPRLERLAEELTTAH